MGYRRPMPSPPITPRQQAAMSALAAALAALADARTEHSDTLMACLDMGCSHRALSTPQRAGMSRPTLIRRYGHSQHTNHDHTQEQRAAIAVLEGAMERVAAYEQEHRRALAAAIEAGCSHLSLAPLADMSLMTLRTRYGASRHPQGRRLPR